MTEQQKVELEVLKGIFKDNEALIKSLRNLFFGYAISEDQKKIIKDTFKDEKTRELFRKKIYPKPTDDAPIGNISDQWVHITEDKILGASKEYIYQLVESRKLTFQMLDKAMLLLENPDGEKVDVSFSPNIIADELQIGLLARNKYMNTIEASLAMIYKLVEQKEMSEDERKLKESKDSTK